MVERNTGMTFELTFSPLNGIVFVTNHKGKTTEQSPGIVNP